MNLIFSHGLESGPNGYKIKRLAVIAERHGLTVNRIDYTDTMDAEVRVERLKQIMAAESEPPILLGSSIGGYVSVVASGVFEAKGMFLLAPALFMPSLAHQAYASKVPHIEVVHGWSDDIIPVENTIRFAREADCTIHVLPENHTLNDSLDRVESLFDAFLEKVLA